MLKVNRKKHDEFENEYAEMALKVMESKRLEGYDDIADEDWPSFVLREFYEKIVEYGLADEMGLEKLSDQVVERSLDDIRYFIKKLLLATPEQIHRAHIYLKSMKKNLNSESPDISKDTFLQSFQKTYYRAMCERKDERGVKYNVRILKSLGIRSCPYCGCEYIGGRGKKILGAELDHFVNKTDYPFFALCLYNLIPSCSACNNHKRKADDLELISPFEEKADFDSNIGIRLHSRPFVREEDGTYHESSIEVRVISDRYSEEYDRYKKNIKVFALQDIYEDFEDEAALYLDRMVRYPGTQVEEIEQILAMDGIDEWQSRVRYRHRLEQDLFLDRCAEGTEQSKKPESKMYTDLYRTYRQKN